jgi:hypothetical protein
MSQFAKIAAAVAVVVVFGLAGFFGVRMVSGPGNVYVGSAVDLSPVSSGADDEPAKVDGGVAATDDGTNDGRRDRDDADDADDAGDGNDDSGGERAGARQGDRDDTGRNDDGNDDTGRDGDDGRDTRDGDDRADDGQDGRAQDKQDDGGRARHPGPKR